MIVLMRALVRKLRIFAFVTYGGLAVLAFAPAVLHYLSPPAYASPFGQGIFGANIGFGAATSLSVALSGNVNLNLTSNGSQYAASGSHTITVTSSDVVGYSLYAYALGNSAMTSGASTIPASSNSTAGTLALNTWGYNLDGSANYLGMGTTPQLIKTSSGTNLSTYKSGETTTVTYGVATDFIKPAGSYSVSVVYIAACLSQ